MEEAWTILKVLQWTSGYFERKGIEQPRANAEVLLAHVLGKQRIELYLHHDQPLTPAELARYREAVRRRAAREPTQYITEKQEFWSLEFAVCPSVLIPRPETEILVERALELLGDAALMVLDLGTGSGAIAVALGKQHPSARIFATDASLEALVVARCNAERHHVEHRIAFAAMDLFGGFSVLNPPFDLIVSNPPYIADHEFPDLAPEIARHEPENALRGKGPDGLGVIRRIVEDVSHYLKPGGTLLMEIGQGQAEILEKELTGNPLFDEIQFIQDYSGILRVLQLHRVVAPTSPAPRAD